MKAKDIATDESDVHRLSEQKVELEKNEVYQHEWDLEPGEYESVAAMIEILNGDAQIEFQGPPGPDLSKLKQVRLYAGRLTKNIRKVAVRIRAATATTLRVTVAFLKKEAREGWKRISCKACKTLIRLCISALLTSTGLPPLDIDLPMKEYLHLDKAVAFLSQLIQNAGGIPEGLAHFISGLGPQLWPALKGALEWFNWATETVDRVFEGACRVVGCCAEKKA